MDQSGAGALPSLQDGWLGVLTPIPSPRSEPKATCGDCVMCAGPERSGTRVRFSPSVKCCSYVPHLANFLAGRALAGPGRSTVLDRMRRRVGVTPLGVGLGHADVLRLVGASARFGRDTGVRCPHYQLRTGGCAIWESRNAVCSTWFCQHERGVTGQRFWQAVRDLLIAAEERFSYRCLAAGDMPDGQVADVLAHRAAVRETIRLAGEGRPPEPPADEGSEEWYARMWRDWAGREEEWFALCAERVGSAGPDDLVALMDGVRGLADGATAAWSRVADAPPDDVLALPEHARLAPAPGSEVDGDVLRLVGYSPFDPVQLPVDLLPALERLTETADELDPAVLRTLLDFGLVRGDA